MIGGRHETAEFAGCVGTSLDQVVIGPSCSPSAFDDGERGTNATRIPRDDVEVSQNCRAERQLDIPSETQTGTAGTARVQHQCSTVRTSALEPGNRQLNLWTDGRKRIHRNVEKSAFPADRGSDLQGSEEIVARAEVDRVVAGIEDRRGDNWASRRRRGRHRLGIHIDRGVADRVGRAVGRQRERLVNRDAG